MVFENSALGPLEADIMQIVWRRKQCSVQEVFEELTETRAIAYNTVMTVMTRLAQKDILTREKNGRAFLYYPATSKAEVGESMLKYVIDKIFGGSRVRVYSQLIERDDLTSEEINYLEKLVQEKKKEVEK